MYYQILIESTQVVTEKKAPRELYELDVIEKDDVLRNILVPYIEKEEFQFDGYFLDPQKIRRIVVKTTNRSVRELSKYENDHMTPGLIMYVSPESILDYDNYATDVTREMIADAKHFAAEFGPVAPAVEAKTILDRSKVFIVHGHDELIKVSVARFIEKMGYEPIILHEQATSGKTIIEKIEEYSDVGFGIILYTPCDVGAMKDNEDNLQPRARQNVVFEHGYLIGKIGRNNVCALVKDAVETPNDISGVVYVPIDSHGAWQLSLAKELRNSGYDVDMNLVV